jgi:hypothetical protein
MLQLFAEVPDEGTFLIYQHYPGRIWGRRAREMAQTLAERWHCPLIDSRAN